MRRTLLILIMGLGLGSISLGNESNFLYSNWRVYQVKDGDWLLKIMREAKSEGLQVGNSSDFLKEILKMNPQIEDENQIYPGIQILVPFNLRVKRNDTGVQNAQVIHNHYYYNPVIYQNGALESRRPSARGSSSIPLPKESEVPFIRGLAIEVGAGIEFALLESTTSSGGRASLASKGIYPIRIGASHFIFEEQRLDYKLTYRSLDVIVPDSQTSVTGSGDAYIEFSLASNWEVSKRLQVVPRLSYQEHPYLTTDSEGIALEKIKHFAIGTEAKYSLISVSWIHALAVAGFDYYLPSSGDTLESDGGVSWDLGLHLQTELLSESFQWTVSNRFYSLETDSTEQTDQNLVFGINWSKSF